MAIKALNKLAASWYVPRSERDENDAPVPGATRFKLRGLSGGELGYVHPELKFDAENTIIGISGAGLDYCLRHGLKDWENFANDHGALACTPANFELIDIGTRTELAIQILAASFVTSEEKKT